MTATVATSCRACPAEVGPGKLFCPGCWRLVPAGIKRQLLDAVLTQRPSHVRAVVAAATLAAQTARERR